MTDDKLREACARARGWEWVYGSRPARWWIPYADPSSDMTSDAPPLDGNTAIALLELSAYKGDVDLVADCINNTVFCDVDGRTVDVGSISARNIILGALLALGEISENDVAV